jgi:hypothetical protein
LPGDDVEMKSEKLRDSSVRLSMEAGDTVPACLNRDGRRTRALVIALSLSRHIDFSLWFSVRLSNKCCWSWKFLDP